MSIEAWPSILPKPNADYGIISENEVAVTKFETGQPLQRLRFDTHYETINVSWLFDNNEYFIFKNWFANKLLRGTKKFNIALFLGGVESAYEAQWINEGNPYTVSYQHVLYWQVQASLLIQDTQELSEAATDIVLESETASTDFVGYSDELDDYVENILPTHIINN